MSKAFQYRPMAQRVTARPPTVAKRDGIGDETVAPKPEKGRNGDASVASAPDVQRSGDESVPPLADHEKRIERLEAQVALLLGERKAAGVLTSTERSRRHRARKKQQGMAQ